jgi:predicted enzyme related to lactoylglutathione lyase
MRTTGLAVALSAFGLALTGLPPAAVAAPAPIVFFDIASSDLAGEAAFYKSVFDWDADANGRLTVPVASPLPGLLRVEQAGQAPVAERVIYVGVPDINAALARITAHGGSIVFPRSVVPGVVILALFKDPAGNRMGLVEMDGDKPKVPQR